MRTQIEQSKAFKRLEPFQQSLLLRRDNRLQIEDAIITAHNIGIDTWQAPAGMPKHWQAIVKEVASQNLKL